MQGIISIVFAAIIVIVLYVMSKKVELKMTTKSVVAVGIGAALYAALSAISLPIGPNTSFRLAIALLPIFGAIFGPIVGFLVGFIGHALNDAMMWGSVWWSWVFLSAMLGLFGGMIRLDKTFDVQAGKIEKQHIIKMYAYALVGMVAASAVAYAGDILLYGEPADKVWLQIILASSTNLVVVAVIGIPAIIALAKRNKKNSNLEIGEEE